MTEIRELLMKAQAGDKEAREQLVQKNIGLVKSIVSRYTARGVEKEDLIQIGMIGLIKAIDNFDTTYEVRFSTYAVPMIAGEIRRFLRDNGAIKVSRSIKDHRVAVNRSREQLIEKLGREPTIHEIAEDVGLSMEDILLAVNSGQEVASLQQMIYEGDGSSIRLMDRLSAHSGEGDASLDRMMLADSLSALEQRERELIVLRFYYDQTQSQIAKRMGVSQVQVSRLEKRILRKMKMYIS
ncbi:MAG: SigB/SigF/SigG family RNA polymerase sigma factor [Coprococcus sp.]